MSTRPNSTSAIVVGAGVGGLTAAAALRPAGADVTLCERAPQLRAAGFGLAVQSNAMLALRTLDLGIEENLLRIGGRVSTFSFRDTSGRILRSVDVTPLDSALGAPSVVLARKDLHDVLLTAAGDGLRVETGAAAERFDDTGTGVALHLSDGRRLEADVLVGADGINSTIRAQLHGAQRPRPGGFVCWLALAPFYPSWLREGESVHYWGRGRRFGLHDCGQGTIYWWATESVDPELAANWPHGKDDLLQRFSGWTPQITDIISATTESDIITVPALDRPPLTSWGNGPVTLLGDAAHPMLPSLGQGANSAIEDAIVLAHALSVTGDPRASLRAYERRRLPRTTELVTGSQSLGRIEQSSSPAVVAARAQFIRRAGNQRVLDMISKPMTWPGFGDLGAAAALPRRLSTLERWHWTADRISPLHICARVRLDGPVDTAALRLALDAVAQRHPLIQTTVRAARSGPSFVPAPRRPIPLRLADTASWVTEMDRELAEPFDDAGPLLRATLVTVEPGVSDLILTSTYTVCDGITITELCRQVLDSAGETADHRADWHPEIPAPPGPEELMPNGFRGIRGKLRTLGRLVADGIPERGAPALKRLPAQRQVPAAARRTRFAHRVITGAAAQDLLAACREHGVSPQSAVAAALATAASIETGGAPARFAVSVSVPFREHLTVRPDAYATGSYQAMVAAPVDCVPGRSLWQAATDFDVRMRTAVDNRHHLANLGSLGAMSAGAARFADRLAAVLDERGPGNLCVSLIDTADFPEHLGNWSVSGIQVVSGMSISGYLMLYVTVGRDELALNLGHVDGIVSPDRAESLLENTAAALRGAVTGSEPRSATPPDARRPSADRPPWCSP
ncbi:2-polyprenyl-6-methoxyphenol hydroxylase-like FAD-dependent oxidoreductase [Mycobacterium frederiksbergense]|uniref:2-polyprenyl-6-methoxyphenol hydroxylase-like FAD-dependent oxidoreductase n=1 Tax=Mycolicibacterium frederiksbergense TaxID=117567 RepID=A0ABT6L2Z9_9MYCO|nr:FAD-dependent monooxygenase [Mycolicibacterium frederiksbergense]MDH6197316.1 2-polyprenyl-6-methoxyphenol hydroxylase-like FAD-dependent oxidoreductase [Mycolicibacterium frederiksbergense]